MTDSEYRAKRKKAHLCIQCGEQDAYTLAGRSRCAICAEKNLASKKTRNKQKDAERAMKAYRERVSKGVCAHCGGKVDDGHITCKKCRIRSSARIRARDIANGMNWPRGSNGICYTCNKKPVLDGFKVCKQCYDKIMQTTSDRIERFGSRPHESVKRAIDDFWKLKKAGML